ncbi:MAG: GNAT family N-acetyltransferase [Verrucomicrobiales bacterium]
MEDQRRLEDARFALVFPTVGLVALRPIVQEDEQLVSDAFERLSELSRFRRFWSRLKALSPAQLKNLTLTDSGDHMGWVIIDPSPDAEFPALGAASFWRDRKMPSRAEISFTVADEWQNTGFGTLVLAALWISAFEAGVEQFFAVVEPGNRAIAKWLERLGGKIHETPAQLEIVVTVIDPVELTKGTGDNTNSLSKKRFVASLRTLLGQNELGEIAATIR